MESEVSNVEGGDDRWKFSNLLLKIPGSYEGPSCTWFIVTRSLRSLQRPFSTTKKVQMAVQTAITQKLQGLKPVHLEVINESYMHNVPKGSETHFKVVIVSDDFKGKTLLQRHRLVNEILKDELTSSIHALSIQAKLPEQWEASGHKVNPSPPCMGGGGR